MARYHREWCGRIIDEFLEWPASVSLRFPVDPERDGAPNYLDIVKHPMDLTRIKKKLTDGSYTAVDDVRADLELMASNAQLFNGAWSFYAIISQDLVWQFDNRRKMMGNSAVETLRSRVASAVEDLARHGDALATAFREAGATEVTDSPLPLARSPAG